MSAKISAMNTTGLSRRGLLLGGASLAAVDIARSQGGGGDVTAMQVIDRIKANVGVPWRAETVDRIVFGSPETPVKGIASTMMATLDVVERAAAGGKNMVITHEPTFYSHQDTVDALKQDATYQYKVDFLGKHNMVVFRFHDHWHMRHPDGIATGMAQALGWTEKADPQEPLLFRFPGTPLGQLAAEIQSRLKIRTMRVVGDANLPVNRALASWGYASLTPGIQSLARADVDVLVVGETREWEVVEYAQDLIASGRKKALIVMGHVVSEQSGMKYCAEWLKPFIPEVPIEFIAAPEPFWSPDGPRPHA